MARTVMAVGAMAWTILGAAVAALAAFGAETVADLLPPLAIDTDALGGATLALAVGLLVVATGHAVAWIGLRRAWRWGGSVGILVGALVGASLVALLAASLTSLAAGSGASFALAGAAAVTAAGALLYGLAVAQLIRSRRG